MLWCVGRTTNFVRYSVARCAHRAIGGYQVTACVFSKGLVPRRDVHQLRQILLQFPHQQRWRNAGLTGDAAKAGGVRGLALRGECVVCPPLDEGPRACAPRSEEVDPVQRSDVAQVKGDGGHCTADAAVPRAHCVRFSPVSHVRPDEDALRLQAVASLFSQRAHMHTRADGRCCRFVPVYSCTSVCDGLRQRSYSFSALCISSLHTIRCFSLCVCACRRAGLSHLA